jgi:hypothetical protein
MLERDIEIRGGAQLGRVVRALNEVDKDLKRELTAGLRAVGRSAIPKVRDAIDQIPTKGDGTLKGEMKAATRVQLRSSGPMSGMTIRVDGRKMPAGKRSLPKYMEGLKPWRHPVFGNRGVWVTEQSHPYFFKTVEPLGKEFGVELNAIARRIAEKLQ